MCPPVRVPHPFKRRFARIKESNWQSLNWNLSKWSPLLKWATLYCFFQQGAFTKGKPLKSLNLCSVQCTLHKTVYNEQLPSLCSFLSITWVQKSCASSTFLVFFSVWWMLARFSWSSPYNLKTRKKLAWFRKSGSSDSSIRRGFLSAPSSASSRLRSISILSNSSSSSSDLKPDII